MSFYQDRPVVNRYHLKEQVSKYDQNIVNAQQDDIRIDPQKALPPDQLHKSQHTKAQTDKDRYKSEPVRDRINRHMYTGQLMNPHIESGKTYPCSILPNRLHINALDHDSPQGKRTD